MGIFTMFTGIVEIMGVVSELNPQSEDGGTTLTISNASEILDDCHLGDSISVNGTCLTVTHFDKNSFKVGVAPETLRRTNLGSLKQIPMSTWNGQYQRARGWAGISCKDM